ncbi:MAG: hypothetical protein AAGJ35_00875, partial [Myxococcota bacterium]
IEFVNVNTPLFVLLQFYFVSNFLDVEYSWKLLSFAIGRLSLMNSIGLRIIGFTQVLRFFLYVFAFLLSFLSK